MKKYLLLILLLLDSFFVFSQGIGFLGKSKLSVKKEMNAATGLATKIKSGGYEGLAYQSRSSSGMFFAVFNNKGICFLDGIIIENKDLVDVFLMHFVNDEKKSYKVYAMDPEKNRFHEFIDGKTTIELYASVNKLGKASYTLYSFNSNYKKDVESYFEKKYAKEYIMAKKHEDEVEHKQLRIQKINNIMSKADEKSARKFVVKYFFDKLIKESEYWDVFEKPVRKNIEKTVSVVVYVDSLRTAVVSIDNDDVDMELGELYRKVRGSGCRRIWDTDYYEYKGSVFYSKEIHVETDYVEKGLYGVYKKKNGLFFCNAVPEKLKTWCEANLKDNGFHSLLFTYYNDFCTIKEVDVSSNIKKRLKQKY